MLTPHLKCPACSCSFSPDPGASKQVRCPECARPLKWFLLIQGSQEGPLSYAHLKRRTANHQLQPDDVLLLQGDDCWRPAADVPGLFPQSGSGPKAVPPVRPTPPVGKPVMPHSGRPDESPVIQSDALRAGSFEAIPPLAIPLPTALPTQAPKHPTGPAIETATAIDPQGAVGLGMLVREFRLSSWVVRSLISGSVLGISVLLCIGLCFKDSVGSGLFCCALPALVCYVSFAFPCGKKHATGC